MVTRAHILMSQGGYKKARKELQQVIDYYEKTGDTRQATFHKTNLAAYMHEEGRSMRKTLKLCDECMYADAYATAFMVMGTEKTKAFLDSHPDLDAFLIYNNEKGEYIVWSTPGLKKILERRYN